MSVQRLDGKNHSSIVSCNARPKPETRPTPGKRISPRSPVRSGRNLGAEDIAAAPHGLDEHWNLRIGFDFPAEPADLHVDAPVEDLGFPAARQIEKLIARQNVLGVPGKSQEQIELASRQLDERPFRVAQRAPHSIDPPSFELV